MMQKGNFLLPIITILVIAGACSIGVGINDFIKLGEFSQWLGGVQVHSNEISQMTFDNPEITSFPVYQWYVMYEVQQLILVAFEVLLGLIAFCAAGVLYCMHEIKHKSNVILHSTSDTIFGGSK